MAEPGSLLLAFSDHAAELVERTAGSIVVVHGGPWGRPENSLRMTSNGS